MVDQLVERLFRHMAWANGRVLELLQSLPDHAIHFSAWNPYWTVGKLAHHIVISQGRLVSRITREEVNPEIAPPKLASEISQLVGLSSGYDARLLSLVRGYSDLPDAVQFGGKDKFRTSTILIQAVQHASEHRVQIADTLASNGLDVLNLDEIDLWAFERWESTN